MNPIATTSLIPKVVEVAKRFIGQKETPGNSGFVDAAFLKEMQTSGFMRGMSWCALFAETVFRIACLEAKRAMLWNNLDSLFSSSALETLHRFQKKGYSVKQTPSAGDLVIWRHGAGPAGHIGIVVDVNPATKTFTSVEGNTTTGGGVVANGDAVCLKSRRYGMQVSNKPGAFNLMGFISVVQ